MNKNTVFLMIVLILGLLLTACGGSETSQAQTTVEAIDGQQETLSTTDEVDNQKETQTSVEEAIDEQVTQITNEVSGSDLEMTLLLGTFVLEGTDLAVDVEQAGTLLPLWQAVKSLSESDTTAVAELDALCNQIEGAMTDEQMAAIENADLDMQSVNQIIADMGLEIPATEGRQANMTEGQRAEQEAMREPGGGDGSGQGRGPGGGGGGGGEMTPPEGSTPGDGDGSIPGADMGMGGSNMFVDAVIVLLESKLQ